MSKVYRKHCTTVHEVSPLEGGDGRQQENWVSCSTSLSSFSDLLFDALLALAVCRASSDLLQRSPRGLLYFIVQSSRQKQQIINEERLHHIVLSIPIYAEFLNDYIIRSSKQIKDDPSYDLNYCSFRSTSQLCVGGHLWKATKITTPDNLSRLVLPPETTWSFESSDDVHSWPRTDVVQSLSPAIYYCE